LEKTAFRIKDKYMLPKEKITQENVVVEGKSNLTF
jgi:hypothetical protein